MANTVQVTFGANIEPLVNAVEGAKKAIEGFVAAFAVDKVAEFIDVYAKMGEQIERNSAMLGVSTKSVQELGYIAQITGGSADGMATSIERLELNLQRAQSPTSQQALALHALGLSAKQLIGIPVDEQMNRIADAVAKFADGGNKTAIVMALLGRSGAQMIPILDQGRSGLEELRQSADNTGAVMSQQTVEALAKLDRATVGLKASISGLSGTILGELAPALAAEAKGITGVIGDVDIAIQTHTVWEREMIALQTGAMELWQALKNLGTITKDVFTLNWSAIASDRQAGLDLIAAIQQAGDDKINAIAKRSAEQLQQIMSGASEGNKPQAPAIDTTGRDQLAAEIANLNTMASMQEAYYRQQEEHINSLAKMFEITEAQKTQMLLAAVAQREAFQTAEMQQGMSLQGLTAEQYQKFQDEMTRYEQKAAADRQKINDQAMQQTVQEWNSGLSMITGAFNSQLRGLLSGQETWSQAWKKMLGDMIIKFIEFCEQMAVKWLATQIAMKVGSGGAQYAGAIAAIQSSMGQMYAAEAAWFAPALGPAAPAAAMGVVASTEATALSLSSFAVGAENILRGGLAIVHPGETIVPEAARSSGPFTGESLGGHTINVGGIHVHAAGGDIDGAALARDFIAEIRRKGIFAGNKWR